MLLELFGPSKRKAQEEEKRFGPDAMKRRGRGPEGSKLGEDNGTQVG